MAATTQKTPETTNLLSDEGYMRRCLELALKGRGSVAPNPLVGCVIVKDGKIISEGFHASFGALHAERAAILATPNPEDLIGATLYVNLEPCVHHGKTPPCTEIIASSGISRVVYGCIDPNPLISGSGAETLALHNIEVVQNILQKECQELNRRFITHQTKKRPYIILKWAETKDGFFAKNDGSQIWISSDASRALVHQWRAEETAILTGTNTAVIDNPQLNTRLVPGKSPHRLVIDRKGRIPPTHHLLDMSIPTFVFTESASASYDNLCFVKLDFTQSIPQQILTFLHSRHLSSLIVEGGAKTINSFLALGLWDEARVFVGEMEFGAGIRAPEIDKQFLVEELGVGVDLLKVYRDK